MSCSSGCYEATIESCNDIIIRAGFTPDSPLYWLIQKVGSNNIHQRLTIANGEGDLPIPKSDLPDGYLIKGAYYKIQIRNGSEYLQPVSLTFGETQYSCILLSLNSFDRADDDESGVNIIQFTGAIIPEGDGEIFA